MGTPGRRIGRLGAMAMGLGLAAAVAVRPGVTAPAPPDIDISMDGVTLAAWNIDISIFGIDLFNGGGTAHATSGFGDMAIAIGPNAQATAEGGFGDFASAFSTGNDGVSATAGDTVAGATGNNFDVAGAFGDFSRATAGNVEGFSDTTRSSFDFASAVGNGTAGDPTSVAAGENGSFDSASALGNQAQAAAGFSNDAAHPPTSTPRAP